MAQRLIDANALTDKVDKYIYRITIASKRKLKVGESAILADIKAHIELSPTIDAEPHWIPCSKKLPEYFEPVITWDGHCYFVEKRIPYIRDEDGNPIKGKWWVSDDYDEEETDYYPNLRDGAAIAWMPLPEPYEVEE